MTDTEIISSSSGSQIKEIKALLTRSSHRKKTGLFVAEGLRMVSETPPQLVEKVYVSRSFLESHQAQEQIDIPGISAATVVEDKVFKGLSDTVSPQGVLAVVRQRNLDIRDIPWDEPVGMYLFLEGIQDPGNLGTMIRSAEGAGARAVIMDRDCADIYNPKTVRSTMGSMYRVPFYYSDDLISSLYLAGERGVRIYAAAAEGSRIYTEPDYSRSCGFIIGNEGRGLSREALAAAHEKVRIPMGGSLESLNASVAAAVLMYETVRQRNYGSKY